MYEPDVALRSHQLHLEGHGKAAGGIDWDVVAL